MGRVEGVGEPSFSFVGTSGSIQIVQAVDALVTDAQRMSDAEFAVAYGDLFLLKRPSTHDSKWDEDIEYQTQYQNPNPDLEDEVAFEASWRVAMVRKRPGNPYPNRISVGRAKNCDIVIRLSQISKLHAAFITDDRHGLTLADQRSVNGTTVDGVALQPGKAAPVFPGNVIGFGQISVQLVEGARFYQMLRRGEVG